MKPAECVKLGWHYCTESSFGGAVPGHFERRIAQLKTSLRDLRVAATDAYKAGRVDAEPFVRAGNVLDEDE